jgi:hypothetical protein
MRFASGDSWKASLGASAAIIAATAAVLFSMGRVAFCRCGIVHLWSWDIWSNQNSQQLIDPYTFSHILHGVIVYGLLWLVARKRFSVAARLVCAVALESGWEILENTDFIINRYRESTISLDYYGDSVLNSIGDILAMMLGFMLAWHLPVWAVVSGAILVDAGSLLLIRDSLAVNIIMLSYPIEAIRQWQLR